jgi:hypothetical protein
MDEQANSGVERTLSLRLDIHLDREPISGRLRTEGGAEERFVGWLGFVDALKRLNELEEGRDARKPGATGRPRVYPNRMEPR